ncbi:MAG: ABC transporter permease subunit [Nitrospinaceae bacterium]|nr:MAG: ABC transporter permease subunit [Nitrospinaceae bacterium]
MNVFHSIRRLCFRLAWAALLLYAGTPSPVSAAALVYGADAEGGAPYIFPDPQNPEHLIGFEVDLAEALAREMGRSARHAQTDWDSLIPSLVRGDFDIALNGIEWTEARERKVALSRPYYIYSQQLVVRAGDPSIQSFADVSGKRVATLKGTAANDLLDETPGAQPVLYEGQVEPYRDLALGRVDAVLLDTPIAAYYARSQPGLRYAGKPLAPGKYVIAIRKGDTALLAGINAAIASLLDSGELHRIYARWGLWNEAQRGLENPAQAPAVSEKSAESLWFFLPLLARGAWVTLVLSLIAMSLAITLGLVLALMRRLGGPLLRPLAVGIIEFIRGTPLLLQLYIIYYGLPGIGIRLDAFTAAVLGLGINYAAYETEIYRASIDAVPHGQTDAALSLGMTPWLLYRRILIPQAVRTALPPMTNDFIALLKDSSLVSIITIVELTKSYNMLAVSSMRFLELGLLTAALYLLMSFPLSLLSSRLERRLAPS